MAMKNLSIAQHRDTLRYACIHSGAYRPRLQRFRQGDYIYLQCEASTTLDIRAGRTPSGEGGVAEWFVVVGRQ